MSIRICTKMSQIHNIGLRNPEQDPEPDPNLDADLYVSGTDPRIRTKMSRIYNTLALGMLFWIQLQ